MSKRNLFIPAVLSLLGTSAYLLTKKQKENKQDNISQNLVTILSKHFGRENLKGYWIDFDNQDGLEYACGVNVENEEHLIDSYTFLFNPESNDAYGFKLITSKFE
ncbi:hypothetical protein ACQW5G_08410 [Fructilactobacillus sp. Tb1]|uniref:hypothetical protein n=1 Tax=Fructilactobacillus sp. Tb1 TaxID=3422304 RepID=UPI003D2AC43C